MSQKSYDNSPTLYLIPTPIGNMQDITLRSIKKKLIASHKFNEEKNKEKLIEYLEKGFNVGLASDRGTPIISDPGYTLAQYAILKGYNVVGLPGATALIPALIMSGLSPQPFLFYGFLNNKDVKRKNELAELKKEKATIIFYEAPHRIEDTLDSMLKILGNRKISISREISKKFEEVYRGSISEIIEQIKDAKGEFVIVVDGNHDVISYENLTIIEHVNLYIKEGYDSKEAIKMVAKDRNIPKSDVYTSYHIEKK